MGSKSSKSPYNQHFNDLTNLKEEEIENIWTKIKDFQNKYKVIFISKDVVKLYNNEISKRISNPEKFYLKLNITESCYTPIFNQKYSEVPLFIPAYVKCLNNFVLKLNLLAFISFNIECKNFSKSIPFNPQELLKEYQKFFLKEEKLRENEDDIEKVISKDKILINEAEVIKENTVNSETIMEEVSQNLMAVQVEDNKEFNLYMNILERLEKDITIPQIDNIIRSIRQFYNEFGEVKSFFTNAQIKDFEKEAYKHKRNCNLPDFKNNRESSVALFDDKYNLILIVRSNPNFNIEINFVLNYMANVTFCYKYQNYNSKAIYQNSELEKINSKIQNLFIDLNFKQTVSHENNISNFNLIPSKPDLKHIPKIEYFNDEYKDFSSYREFEDFTELKILKAEQIYLKDLKIAIEVNKVNLKNNKEVITFLDLYFNYKETKNDYSRGLPNYGNTCYLNVGIQVMKALRFNLLWMDLFDFEDETFLNLFIILRYWTESTITKINEPQLIAHFKSFVINFFEKNNYKDFKILKMNDSCSFILNLFNLLVKNKLGIDSLASDIENNLQDSEDDSDLNSVINQNIKIIKDLEIERPYLFSIYTYFITRDEHGNFNSIRPYFDVSEKVYVKNKNKIQNIFAQSNSTLYVKYAKILIIKLKIEYENHIFQNVEHFFEVRDLSGKVFTYELKAISYSTGKSYGHTFCSCWYGKWLKYDDDMPVKVIQNFKMDIAYTLNYELVEK